MLSCSSASGSISRRVRSRASARRSAILWLRLASAVGAMSNRLPRCGLGTRKASGYGPRRCRSRERTRSSPAGPRASARRPRAGCTRTAPRVVIADLNAEKGEALAAELGERASFVEANVLEPDQVQAAVDAATERRRAADLGLLRGDRLGAADRLQAGPARPRDLLQRDQGQPDRHLQRAAARGDGDGRQRARRGRRARRLRQHRLDRRLRRPDRPGRLLGLEGRDRRPHAAGGARPRRPRRAGGDDRARALRHAAARGAAGGAARGARRRDPLPVAARPARPSTRTWSRAIVANPMLNGETIRLDGALRMPPR